MGEAGAGLPGCIRVTQVGGVSKLSKYLQFIDLSALEATLRETASFLGVDLGGALLDGDISPLAPAALHDKLTQINNEMSSRRDQQQSLREKTRGLQRELNRLVLQRAHVEMLGPLKVDIGSMQGLKRFCAMPGTIPRDNLESLERSLNRLPHTLIPYRADRHLL